MTKDRRNISIDPEVNEAIDENRVFSDLVNEWARQYFVEGNTYNVEKALLEDMLAHVEESREAMHEQVDEMHDELAARFESEIDHLDTVGYDERKQTGSDAQWEQAEQALEHTPLEPDNPAVRNWSQKLNVEPTALIERLES
jgi:hypothetical protein